MKYNIKDVDSDGYNYVKMIPGGNSYFCKFSIPLKKKIVNGFIRMIPREDGFWIKLFDVVAAAKTENKEK